MDGDVARQVCQWKILAREPVEILAQRTELKLSKGDYTKKNQSAEKRERQKTLPEAETSKHTCPLSITSGNPIEWPVADGLHQKSLNYDSFYKK